MIGSEGQYNSIIYEEKDSYRGTTNRWSVMLSPEDIKQIEIKNGDYIDLVSETGRMAQVEV